ncbi:MULTISPECIES: hypothetical protein [Achromobacter]|uniref:Uncharacterized protein n=1 Tax=Achromobacter spanius TaxID=217203 RepID=A0ABY8GUB4_9BURK|nr:MULTISPECIES: hypothetical protein [Achromobacter]WAI82291.1 hypothetical protein N8Z00_22565 [Achromobacter spanius]WEX92379.1 hypothetical protein N3Z32_17175 [Achromobacter sp. SS2-2022]WFP08471.1 hypothetical protein P8T11_00960 [Achromobacter spanius]
MHNPSFHEPKKPLSLGNLILSAGGIAAISGVLTWFGTTSYERGEQSSQLQHLSVKLAKLENVDERRVAMKERAETAERDVKDLRDQMSRLRGELESAKRELGKAQASIYKAEKCVYLETLARSSEIQYLTASKWAVDVANGYTSQYYREASSNYGLDRTNLTACLTSSTN